MSPVEKIEAALEQRFGEKLHVDPALAGLNEIARIAGHGTHRAYLDKPINEELLRLLCACALSAPSKSDLQQTDILILRDKAKRETVAGLIPDMPWIAAAPAFLVFLANGRRLTEISRLRGKPFANDHLDAFFNAAVDAGIVLSSFIRAAESVGLRCCPISVIRDHVTAVSKLLELPPRVVPVAGLCVGWPQGDVGIVPRLPLALTLHEDRFDDRDLASQLDAYDKRRAGLRPYRAQRQPERFGKAALYGWSEDKARQYADPQRADFGAYVRAQGFKLD
ncbi:MAG TPA: nitroreductase family protein [Pseudolabrys sp.]|nr:nitroreductase family protein [Pseudolabrys sp.]